MGNANANQIAFGQRIEGRQYGHVPAVMDGIINPISVVCKGDVVLYDCNFCIVIRAAGKESLTVVELPLATGTKDKKFTCPIKEPIFNSYKKSKSMTELTPSSPREEIEYKSLSNPLVWRHPMEYLVVPVLRCSGEKNWDQYKEWFNRFWCYIQYQYDKQNGLESTPIKDSPRKQELIFDSIKKGLPL